ncbi:hypothetical protein Malapachy_0786 [Malassezia pachydermatis]|uniref:Uncharacterized protein n=1 Tax=Malassezia pachydermatis TaxID=77020 RepID=A0A0M8MWA5_9BASI|nr:hypothetical protein Malapachy_0786 [Malassezia pachydermatis]KOS14841.1 hypothetical protein Malapachy_0786 [Malassezia pachydermatis]
MSASNAEPVPVVKSQSLDFISSIPLISGAVNYAMSFVHSYPILQRAYNLGENTTVKALHFFSPVLDALHTPLAQVDNFVLKTLTFTKSKIPYPFEVKWEELYAKSQIPIENVHKVVDDYRHKTMDMYDTHVKGTAKSLFEQTGKAMEQLQQTENVYLQKAGETISKMQESLASVSKEYADKSKEDVAFGEKKAEGLYNSIFSELDNLQKFAKTLPAEGQKRMEPFMELFNKTYKDLSSEATDAKVPIQERLTKSAGYLQNKTLPELQKLVYDNLKKADAKKTE